MFHTHDVIDEKFDKLNQVMSDLFVPTGSSALSLIGMLAPIAYFSSKSMIVVSMIIGTLFTISVVLMVLVSRHVSLASRQILDCVEESIRIPYEEINNLSERLDHIKTYVTDLAWIRKEVVTVVYGNCFLSFLFLGLHYGLDSVGEVKSVAITVSAAWMTLLLEMVVLLIRRIGEFLFACFPELA